LSAARGAACADQFFALDQAIYKGRFTYVRPAGERHLGRFIPWVLIGPRGGCDEFGRRYDQSILEAQGRGQ